MQMNLEDLAKGMPMTRLLYQEDSYLRETSCNILMVVPDDRKSAYIVIDQSIFHPKSGGQPSDKGRVAAEGFLFDVKRVMILSGVLIHWGKYLEGVPRNVPAHQEIDWAFRYGFMRRHTAAHLYDHCLSTVLGERVETTDSWVGDDGYIGYRGKLPKMEHLQAAEAMENQMITKGAKVASQLMTRDEALTYTPEAPNIARLPSNTHLRVVTIEGCRGIPCGGTHLKNIAEIELFSLKTPEDLGERFKIRFDITP
jgi:alanyl-tRNA synthetase